SPEDELLAPPDERTEEPPPKAQPEPTEETVLPGEESGGRAVGDEPVDEGNSRLVDTGDEPLDDTGTTRPRGMGKTREVKAMPDKPKPKATSSTQRGAVGAADEDQNSLLRNPLLYVVGGGVVGVVVLLVLAVLAIGVVGVVAVLAGSVAIGGAAASGGLLGVLAAIAAALGLPPPPGTQQTGSVRVKVN
ncbi:MAG: hypothetical protein AB2A00_24510, partial [Myxococcota bacterium]